MKKFSSKIVLFITMMFISLAGINASANTLWDNLGLEDSINDIGGHHQLAVHTDGTPYVVYRKVKSGFYGAAFYTKVIKYDNATGAWVQLGDDTSIPSSVNIFKIAISADGIPYVAFADDENMGRVSVMKYTTEWETVGTRAISENSLTGRYSFDFKIAPNGTPYVAYKDRENGLAVTVKKFNGSEWVIEGATLVSNSVEQNWVSLAISATNIPYVTFTKEIFSKALGRFTKTCVLKFDGNLWVNISTDSYITPWTGEGNDTLAYPTLAISNNNSVFVAYLDSSSPYSVIVKKNSGLGWELVGSALDHIMYDIDVNQYPPSLAVSSAGHPFVTLKAKVSAQHAHAAPVTRDLVMTFNQYTDSDWKIVGSNQTYQNYLDGFFDGTAAYSSLAVDISGVPYVAFQSTGLIIKKYNQN